MNSPLDGGRKGRGRRRAGVLLTVVFLLAVPAAVGAAVYLRSDNRHDGRGGLPLVSNGSPAVIDQTEAVGPAGKTADGVRLDHPDAFRLKLHKPPRGALLFDLGNGRVLWRLHARRTMPIASLTKMMTALLVVQNSRPDDRVKITKAALNYQGSGVGVLPKGRRVRLETLMNGLLLVSGNDAAIALADHVSGNEHRFVRLMNAKAEQLGLRCTHYASSHGLQAGNRSCAADLAALARMDMREPRIRRIVRRKEATFRFPIKAHKIYLYGHNPLIRAGYRGAIGLKTGFTDPAGRCFVGVARRNGRTLGVVLLHSPNPVKQAAALLNKGFATR
jgi:serine-type D-Ala-D-Ala carboxypeptidase (penicillin-binding protein 5/6)